MGFGSWAAGGPWKFGWGPADDDESIAAIRHAVDAGVTWIDTAPVYGLGHAEEVVGRAVEPYPVGEDVLVFTKCGRTWERSPEIDFDLRPESIRRQCEQSLTPTRRGADRPVPVPLARLRDGHAGRGLVGSDGRPRRRGKGALDRRLQLRRRAARALRGGPARRLAAAAPVAAQPPCPGCPRPVVSRARDGRGRLLAAGERAAHRLVQPGAAGAARPRRLQAPGSAVPGAEAVARTLRSSSGSARSPSGSGAQSRRWRWRGHWQFRASLERSSARAVPSRSSTGCPPATPSWTTRCSRRSSSRSRKPAPGRPSLRNHHLHRMGI